VSTGTNEIARAPALADAFEKMKGRMERRLHPSLSISRLVEQSVYFSAIITGTEKATGAGMIGALSRVHH
jgi:hypothetical protein